MNFFLRMVPEGRRKLIRRVPGDGDPAGFYRMCILAMTPFCCYEVPSIGFDIFMTSRTFRRIPPIQHNFIRYICSSGFSPPSTPFLIAPLVARGTKQGCALSCLHAPVSIPPFTLTVSAPLCRKMGPIFNNSRQCLAPTPCVH